MPIPKITLFRARGLHLRVTKRKKKSLFVYKTVVQENGLSTIFSKRAKRPETRSFSPSLFLSPARDANFKLVGDRASEPRVSRRGKTELEIPLSLPPPFSLFLESETGRGRKHVLCNARGL